MHWRYMLAPGKARCASFFSKLRSLSGQLNRPLTPILLKSIAIHLPFLSESIAILLQKYALLLAEISIYTTNLYHDTSHLYRDTFSEVLGSGVVAALLRRVKSTPDPDTFEKQGRPKHNHNHNFPKSFASDATPKRHLMAHQMKNLCGFSVFHGIEMGIWCVIRGYPQK